MLRVLFFCVGLGLSSSYLLTAQTADLQSQSPSPANAGEAVFQQNHRIGWGISIAEGIVTYSNDRGEIMLSMLYSQRISPISELEFSLHYTNVQSYLRGLNGLVPLNSPNAGITIAWQVDGTWMFQPFTNILQPLRLGIGPSLQFWSAIGTYNSFYFPVTTPQQQPNLPLRTSFGSSTALGMNAKIEWLLFQKKGLDVGIEFRLHLFTEPFSGGSLIGVNGGLGSIGVFIYPRF